MDRLTTFPTDVNEIIDAFGVRRAPSDRAGKLQITRNIDFAREHEAEFMAAKPSIFAELSRREHELLYPSTIDYVVNDMTSYGIYNGFSDHDDAVRRILIDDFGDIVNQISFGINHYSLEHEVGYCSRNGEDANRIRSACMPYYAPYASVLENIRTAKECEEEGKPLPCGLCASKILQKYLDDKEAAGVCHVPYDIAKGLIHDIAAGILREYLPDMIKARKDQLARMSAMMCANREEAKKRAKAYNDIVNEGGEGYVPRYYCPEDKEYAESTILSLTELLSKVTE